MISKKIDYRALDVVAVGMVLLVVPELASANILDNFGNAILGILNNGFIRSVGIAAIIIAGLLGLSGRISWAAVGTVLIALVLVFGSAGIVDYIQANSATA